MGLSFGLAVLAILFLIDNWSPLRGLLYVLGWGAVTAAVFWVEYSDGLRKSRTDR
ncbi:hypothetical protein [Nocardia aobensis]|uniref:hypothetical protein n=1 Tax=Nocardia aobensis TaxID=257277 RepID=UPI00030E407D|nr:hypothetical protein [Nocardia aobensis]